MEVKEQMMLREDWLEQAVILLREYMASCSLYLYSYPRASCGFPSRGGEGRTVRTVGQCFSPKVCRDGRSQVFIATVGVEHKYGKVFSQAAKRVGLVRPWRATTIGETLRPVLDRFVTLLGPYPHAAIQLEAMQRATSQETSDVPEKSMGSRLRLYECNCNPPVKVRVASNHFQARCDNLFHLMIHRN
jgi:hypothetical protein